MTHRGPTLLLFFILLHGLALELPAIEAGASSKPIECIPYITHRVCVTGNVTQQQVAESLRPALDQAKMFQSQTCQHAWTAFLCGTAFKKCSYADEAKTITLEHPLCYPFCTEVLSDCRGEFQLDDMEDQLPDCNATLPGTAGETMVYPPASQPYHYTLPDNTTTAYKCFVPGDKDDDVDPHVKCPPHYQALSEEFDDSKYITPCQRECPLGTYSDPEYMALSITQIVEGYFGAVMLVVVLIPFFINFSETNMFPHVVPLYIYISSGLMALGFIWPSFLGGFDEVTCEKDFIVADVTYFPCAVQGILLYWGTASLVTWWFNVCLHLLIGSFSGLGYHSKKLRIFYYFVGWFLPTVGLFIAWVSTQIGASPTSVNCFLDWDAAEGWWANGLFYVEFTIIVCVSFVTLNLAIIRLLTIHGFAGFHKQGRLIVFGYSFLCIFLFMMIYWWVIQTRRGHYEHATDHWFGCLAERFKAAEKAGHPNSGKLFDPKQDYGCELADRNPFGMMYTQTLIFSAIPFLVAMIFGHSWFTWNMWGTIVCSLLCVAIQSLANPSSLFAGGSSSSGSPSPTRRRGGRRHQRSSWTHRAADQELEDVESKVKFVPLGSDDEADDWAGNQDEEAVVGEEDFGGRKGRKRSSANGGGGGASDFEDTDAEGDDTDDNGGNGSDGTDYTEDDDGSDKDV
ncbi:uncharacterized protein ACA1_234100 [Acanthamoeba castellanii str. Neff]|uniref:G-protein coupled receptors family 2 profile 2 domain-containing protein n=1 Tax=Acanthamoeba castellanii (strain ATCC 30010 / Neff) TaxID=1257118 RepID=L8H173_ACACF|nr:uncharacterized protein ACA1_234100 [Acanthamoeba castellanii str. Neff]ELR18972.1 hypothetical protein ACA1_234100 [Acanthamoeba castellanii str. Neff]